MATVFEPLRKRSVLGRGAGVFDRPPLYSEAVAEPMPKAPHRYFPFRAGGLLDPRSYAVGPDTIVTTGYNPACNYWVVIVTRFEG